MNTTIEIMGNCPRCVDFFSITVPHDDYLKWQAGTLIQEAFPYMSIDDRELLISGVCGECWKTMYPVEGDDE
jgi:hypothetical protein